MKLCPICLLDFNFKNSKKKYCSKICKNKSDYIRQSTIFIQLNCVACKKVFSVHQSHKRQKYCSQKCYKSIPKSKKYREKMRDLALKNGNIPPHVKGEMHYRWIEDRKRLKDDHRERGGQLMREWSKMVKSRDKWKCRLSNNNCCGKIESHHILGWKAFPELRYDINNGITLCHYHHPRKRAEEKRLSPYFQEIIRTQKN